MIDKTKWILTHYVYSSIIFGGLHQIWSSDHFLDFILVLLKINEAFPVNKYLNSFVYAFVIYMWNIIKISWLVICKNTPEWRKAVMVRKHKGGLNVKSIVKIYSWIDLANFFCNILLIRSRNFNTAFWIWIPDLLLFQKIHVFIP